MVDPLDRINSTAERLRLVVEGKTAPDDPFGDTLLDYPLPPSKQTKPQRAVSLLSLEALEAAHGNYSWLAKGMIPGNSVGVLFGGSGSFKSFIALDLSLHIAHDINWAGCKTTAGHVIYLAAEGGTGLWKRIQAWHQFHGIDWRQAKMHVIPSSLDLVADSQLVADTISAAGISPVLIVVDTMSQTFTGEENSANEVSNYLSTISETLRARWQCCVLPVHHSGHEATERPRGSSAIRNNTDFLVGAHRDGDSMIAVLSCVKQKDGELFEDKHFRLSVEKLGVDEDGDEITSLVAHYISSTDEIVDVVSRESRTGKQSNNAVLLRVLNKHDGSQEKEIRSEFYEHCDADNQEARKKAFQRSMLWAQKAGIVRVDSGRVIVLKAI